MAHYLVSAMSRWDKVDDLSHRLGRDEFVAIVRLIAHLFALPRGCAMMGSGGSLRSADAQERAAVLDAYCVDLKVQR